MGHHKSRAFEEEKRELDLLVLSNLQKKEERFEQTLCSAPECLKISPPHFILRDDLESMDV